MPGFASTAHPNRHVNLLSQTMMAPVLLVLITGACCWGTYFVRSTVRSTSTPFLTHAPIVNDSGATPVAASTFADLKVEEGEFLERDDLERDNSEEPIVLAGTDHGATELIVQSVLLSPTRRIAMICDHLVSEGQMVTLHGRSFEVTAVSESGVDLAVAETTFHLPFAVSTEPELEMSQE